MSLSHKNICKEIASAIGASVSSVDHEWTQDGYEGTHHFGPPNVAVISLLLSCKHQTQSHFDRCNVVRGNCKIVSKSHSPDFVSGSDDSNLNDLLWALGWQNSAK